MTDTSEKYFEKDGVVRVANTPADEVQFTFDGFKPFEGPRGGKKTPAVIENGSGEPVKS